jgi:hypothetical protein
MGEKTEYLDSPVEHAFIEKYAVVSSSGGN